MLLTVLRMVQGLSVGGELSTSIIFMVERARDGQRGAMGAVACVGATGGMMLGSASGALLASVLPPAALESWGWRIPFLLGLVVGIAGLLPAARPGRGAAQAVDPSAARRGGARPRSR